MSRKQKYTARIIINLPDKTQKDIMEIHDVFGEKKVDCKMSEAEIAVYRGKLSESISRQTAYYDTGVGMNKG